MQYLGSLHFCYLRWDWLCLYNLESKGQNTCNAVWGRNIAKKYILSDEVVLHKISDA